MENEMININYAQAIEINDLPKGTIFVANGVTYEITDYKSENNVWLTDNVPVEYIVLFEED